MASGYKLGPITRIVPHHLIILRIAHALRLGKVFYESRIISTDMLASFR
ncbi:uncharacterized protein METZ01_LOCUS394700, partial [marine metagenome]